MKGDLLRNLADLVDELEVEGHTILDVDPRPGSTTPGGGSLVTTIDVLGSVDAPPEFELAIESVGVIDGQLELTVEARIEESAGTDGRSDRDSIEQETDDRTAEPTSAAVDRADESTAVEPGGAHSTRDPPADERVHGDGAAADDRTESVDEPSTSVAESTDSVTDHSPDTPAYKDPGRLRDAYDRCDTFQEMTEFLDVDVTAQTVRRYMIQYGIHEPKPTTAAAIEGAAVNEATAEPTRPRSETATSSSAGPIDCDGDDRSEPDRDRQIGDDAATVLSDGQASDWDARPPDAAGIATESDDAAVPREQSLTPDGGIIGPSIETVDTETVDGVDVGALSQAVASNRTVHEVGQSLGVDREEARELLASNQLLDLVVGRLGDSRAVTVDDVQRRLRTARSEGHTFGAG